MRKTDSLEEFEKKFRFTMPENFKEFLFYNNGASVTGVALPTPAGERFITQLLNFDADDKSVIVSSAWAVNQRLRSILDARHIIVGMCNSHFLCMERDQRQRKLVIWNYLTQKFEPVNLSIEEFLKLF